jgi:hypothetical protein
MVVFGGFAPKHNHEKMIEKKIEKKISRRPAAQTPA